MKVNDNIILRAGLFYWLLVILAVFFAGRIIYLQFSAENEDGKKYSDMARQMVYGKKNIYPRRGGILSHDGVPLAVSVPSYYVYMDFLAGGLNGDTLTKYIPSLSKNIATTFGGLPEYYQSYFKTNRSKALAAKESLQKRYRTPSYNTRLIKREIDIFELEKLKNFPLYKGRAGSRSGLVVEESSRREHLYGGMAYRTIGYVGKGGISVGIESSYNSYLAGKSLEKTFQVTARNDTIWEENVGKRLKDGDDVISTLDISIQDIAENALLRSISRSNNLLTHGTVVIMEVETGEVRAMVNLQKQKDGSFKETMNHAIYQAVDPGSTFKLASLIAVLESGKVKMEDEFDCGETGTWTNPKTKLTVRESSNRGNGVMNVQTIIEKSSNIGVVKMVLKAFEGKEDKFLNYLYKMNLGEKVGIDLEGEAEPLIKDKEDFTVTTLEQMAMGYEMQISPIQMLTLYNAVANNGKMMKPHVVKGIRKLNKDVMFDKEVLKSTICSKSTLEKVQTTLSAVVAKGTARGINGSPYGICGKTGTAQVAFKGKSGRMVYKEDGKKRHLASFAGYFPEKNPKYSCIVVLYTPSIPENQDFYGAAWAAPVFKEIADKIYAQSPEWGSSFKRSERKFVPDFVAGDYSSVKRISDKLGVSVSAPDKGWFSTEASKLKTLKIDENTVPDVVGMALRDAIYLLETAGLDVSFKGKGRVKTQSIVAGNQIRRGRKIEIELH